VDITVIGAGIAGSALTRIARDRGHRVKLVSQGPPASAAALAAARLTWTDEKERAAWSLGWYDEHGWLVSGNARVIGQNLKERAETGWWLIDPLGPLVEPDEVRPASLEELLSPNTVLATGAPTSGRINYGATAVAPAIAGLPALQVAHLRAYHSVLVGTCGGFTRVGSSKGTTQVDADRRLFELLAAAEQRGLVPRDGVRWTVLRGRRALPGEPRVSRIRNSRIRNLWTMGNYGRLGYSLAPADARDILDTMEAEQR
jgi:hypothetical protein